MTDTLRWDAEEGRKRQIVEADKSLWSDDDGVLYPYYDLNAVAAPIQKSEVDILAGDTGMGKTTAVCSMIERWCEDRVQIVYNGSELPPKVMRAYLACLRLGYHPGEILSGELKAKYDAQMDEALNAPDYNGTMFDATYERVYGPYNAIRKAVSAELKRMGDAGFWEHLHIIEADYADSRALQHQGDLALSLERPGHPVLCIVDHIDHLPDGDLVRESKRSVNTVKNHAKNSGTRWLLTSQLNRTGAIGGDTLWRHRPVQETYLSSGKHKTAIAWRVMGIYRPLKLGVTPDELKAVREGGAETSSVIWDGVNAINFIKHRHFGSRVGRRVLLGWDHGKIVDAPSSVRLALESKDHAIPTRRDW